jgi:hypothetical protein
MSNDDDAELSRRWRDAELSRRWRMIEGADPSADEVARGRDEARRIADERAHRLPDVPADNRQSDR